MYATRSPGHTQSCERRRPPVASIEELPVGQTEGPVGYGFTAGVSRRARRAKSSGVSGVSITAHDSCDQGSGVRFTGLRGVRLKPDTTKTSAPSKLIAVGDRQANQIQSGAGLQPHPRTLTNSAGTRAARASLPDRRGCRDHGTLVDLEDRRAAAGLATGVKLTLSKRLSTSARNSKFIGPRKGKRLVRPMSMRVKNGGRISSVRGAQSPAWSWMQLGTVGGCKVAAFGHAESGIAGRGRGVEAERAAGIEDDVVGQHRDELPAGIRRIGRSGSRTCPADRSRPYRRGGRCRSSPCAPGSGPRR